MDNIEDTFRRYIMLRKAYRDPKTGQFTRPDKGHEEVYSDLKTIYRDKSTGKFISPVQPKIEQHIYGQVRTEYRIEHHPWIYDKFPYFSITLVSILCTLANMESK